MGIPIRCPSCGRPGRVPAHFRGRNVQCSKCGGTFAVPSAERRTELDADPSAAQGEPEEAFHQADEAGAAPESAAGPLLAIKEAGDVLVVRITVKSLLDELTIQNVGREFLALPDGHDRPKIVVNFTGIAYLSSAMLGKIVALNTKVRKAGGKLALCGIASELLEIFKVTALDKLLAIYPTQKKALSDL